MPPDVKGALLWVVLFFAAFSGLSHVFLHEEETGTVHALRLSASAGAVYTGKLLFNLLLLLGVSAVPFPTALLAAHYYSGGRTLAAAVFNGTYVVIAIFFNVLWLHVVRGGLLDASTQESAAATSRQYSIGPISYLICFGLTWISVPASLILNIALAVFFAIPPKLQDEKHAATMRSATK